MKISIIIFLSFVFVNLYAQTVYTGVTGTVDFTSDAPMELIKANSKKMSGAINTADKSFLFNIQMTSFQGFNSDLQRIHFNENYIESSKYPTSKFEGKIIEDIDFSKPGTYTVRAKGNLIIHGVSQQRIIKSTIVITKDGMKIKSQFTVPLTDHKIQIPAVVAQKIAQEIYISINIDLKPKK